MTDLISLKKNQNFKQIAQFTESYYLSKFMPQYDDFSIGPIVNYPDPQGPIIPEGPAGGRPWWEILGSIYSPPSPPPYDPWIATELYVSRFENPIANLGATLGDPNPQPNIIETVQSLDFHLEAAENALASLDKARDALKNNIAELQASRKK